MAWMRTGTVSVTNGSKVVIGSGTAWAANVQAGDAFHGPDGKTYEIDFVSGDASLNLVDSYAGTTASGQGYKVQPTQGRVRDLAAAVSTLITEYGSIEAALTVLASNVGVGIAPNASAKLHVGGQAWIEAATGDAILRMLVAAAEKGKIGVTSTGRVYIESNGAEVVTFLNGNGGVGTNAPASKWDVRGAIATGTDNYTGRVNFGTGSQWYIESTGTATANAQFSIKGWNGASYSQTLTIDSVGNCGFGTNTPAARIDARSAGFYPARIQGTAAASGGGIQVFNDTGTYGVTTLVYGSAYSGGSLLNLGSNGSAIVATGTVTSLGITTDVGNSTGSLIFGTNNTERMRVDGAGNTVTTLTSTVPTLTGTMQMVFNRVSDTQVRLSMRGTDGVTRSTTLTLA